MRRNRQLMKDMPDDLRKSSNRFVRRVVRRCPEQIYTAMKLVIFSHHMHKFTVDHVLPAVDSQLAMLASQSALEPEPLSRAG